jgi:hypothetical protein
MRRQIPAKFQRPHARFSHLRAGCGPPQLPFAVSLQAATAGTIARAAGCPDPANRLNGSAQAPVAQLDRALPSEGKGHTFESCRVRHLALICERGSAPGRLATTALSSTSLLPLMRTCASSTSMTSISDRS